MGTYQPTQKEIEARRKWVLVDASGLTLGRMATRVATILQGKHKPTYVPHMDSGDFVVVVNADKIKLTGKKAEEKQYQRFSGFPHGRKVVPFSVMFEKHPDRVVYLAIKRMVPYTRIGRLMIKKLHVYKGAEHPHVAQKPEKVTISM